LTLSLHLRKCIERSKTHISGTNITYIKSLRNCGICLSTHADLANLSI